MRLRTPSEDASSVLEYLGMFKHLFMHLRSKKESIPYQSTYRAFFFFKVTLTSLLFPPAHRQRRLKNKEFFFNGKKKKKIITMTSEIQ